MYTLSAVRSPAYLLTAPPTGDVSLLDQYLLNKQQGWERLLSGIMCAPG